MSVRLPHVRKSADILVAVAASRIVRPPGWFSRPRSGGSRQQARPLPGGQGELLHGPRSRNSDSKADALRRLNSLRSAAYGSKPTKSPSLLHGKKIHLACRLPSALVRSLLTWCARRLREQPFRLLSQGSPALSRSGSAGYRLPPTPTSILLHGENRHIALLVSLVQPVTSFGRIATWKTEPHFPLQYPGPAPAASRALVALESRTRRRAGGLLRCHSDRNPRFHR